MYVVANFNFFLEQQDSTILFTFQEQGKTFSGTFVLSSKRGVKCFFFQKERRRDINFSERKKIPTQTAWSTKYKLLLKDSHSHSGEPTRCLWKWHSWPLAARRFRCYGSGSRRSARWRCLKKGIEIIPSQDFPSPLFYINKCSNWFETVILQVPYSWDSPTFLSLEEVGAITKNVQYSST